MIEAATVMLAVPVNELDHVMGPTSAMSAVELLTTVKAIVEAEMKRVQIIELCNACLADAVDLQLHCKHAHWNVKGPNFIALHRLFDQVNESVEDYIDLIAERAVQLGGIANSTAHVVTTWAHMPENDTQSPSDHDYVQSLSGALGSFGKVAREAIGKSNELGDAVSADIFTEISRGAERWVWMVQAHLQSQR